MENKKCEIVEYDYSKAFDCKEMIDCSKMFYGSTIYYDGECVGIDKLRGKLNLLG